MENTLHSFSQRKAAHTPDSTSSLSLRLPAPLVCAVCLRLSQLAVKDGNGNVVLHTHTVLNALHQRVDPESKGVQRMCENLSLSP